MFTQNVLSGAFVGLLCGVALISASNPYAPTYNDAGNSYEPQPSYQQQAAYKPQPAYQAPAGYQAPASYEPPASYHAPAPQYHAPAYPKYQAPSSAHHTQYDNYYPKQTYQKPQYAPKQYSAPAPTYYQPAQPQYAPRQAAYPAAAQAPAYAGHQDAEEYKA